MAGRKKTTKKNTRPLARRAAGTLAAADSALLGDLQQLIRQAREQVAQAVNSALVLLNWEVGHRIRTQVLGDKRAGYGEEIVSTLSKELVSEFGSGYSVPNLSRMMSLAELFPDRGVVVTLSRQLGWSHFVEIIPLKDQLQHSSVSFTPKCAASSGGVSAPSARRFRGCYTSGLPFPGSQRNSQSRNCTASAMKIAFQPT